MSGQDQLSSLIVYGDLGRDLAFVTHGGQRNDLQRRIERVTRMNLDQELGGQFGEGDKDRSKIVRQQGRARRGEGKDLKAVDDWCGMAVAPGISHVVVNGMIVTRHGLKGGGMRVGQRPAGRAEYLADLQLGEGARRDDLPVVSVEGEGHGSFCSGDLMMS